MIDSKLALFDFLCEYFVIQTNIEDTISIPKVAEKTGSDIKEVRKYMNELKSDGLVGSVNIGDNNPDTDGKINTAGWYLTGDALTTATCQSYFADSEADFYSKYVYNDSKVDYEQFNF